MVFSLIIAKVNVYIQQREAIKNLSQMEDHELKDMGIKREAIEKVVRGEKIAA